MEAFPAKSFFDLRSMMSGFLQINLLRYTAYSHEVAVYTAIVTNVVISFSNWSGILSGIKTTMNHTQTAHEKTL